ncbi:hypothetical protein FRC04_000601 [Tulasnella sp. 424]|nr:hypothetical protein FRC04_000601 [Tulasnella sp. 424]
MAQREIPNRASLPYRESRYSRRSQTPSYSSSKPPGYTGPRTLVLCFDGTANRPESGHGTNVGILFESLNKHTDKQVCYYQPGIGTYIPPMRGFVILPEIANRVAQVIGGYRFLMDNYVEGDKICLFGFSRGAYVARSLAGMLDKVGLLCKGNEELVPFAYIKYNEGTAKSLMQCSTLKRRYSREANVEFMGLWDTVTSVGISGRTLPFSLNRGKTKHFRQALALDERRAKFSYNPLSASPDDLTGVSYAETYLDPKGEHSGFCRMLRKVKQSLGLRNEAMEWKAQDDLEKHGRALGNFLAGNDYDDKERTEKEVWFIGSHSDVGGYDGKDDIGVMMKPKLSNFSLQWMIQEIEAADVGIEFVDNAFQEFTLVDAFRSRVEDFDAFVDWLEKDVHDPEWVRNQVHQQGIPIQAAVALNNLVQKFGGEDGDLLADEMMADARVQVKDPLRPFSPWWVIEFLPVWRLFLDQLGQRGKEIGFNRGRPRIIYFEPHFHWSVKLRKTIDPVYHPKAIFAGKPTYEYGPKPLSRPPSVASAPGPQGNGGLDSIQQQVTPAAV